MGNKLSRKNQDNEIRELRHRLANLERIDTDKDGLITKEEFATWQDNQKTTLEHFRQSIVEHEQEKFHTKEIKYQNQIIELKKQISTLDTFLKEKQKKSVEILQKTNQNDKLNNDKLENKDEQNSPGQNNLKSSLSQEQIDSVVDKMIDNQAVNIQYLPDFVERQLYRNIFTILLGLLGEIVDESSINFLGHQITMKLGSQN